MKKKGFTLIELLAVIVILAIIALIATPIIMNVIERSREGSYDRSVENILHSADIFAMEMKVSDDLELDKNIYDKVVKQINGDRPEDGQVYVNKHGEVALSLKYGEYCYTKSYGEKSYYKEKTEENCITPFYYLKKAVNTDEDINFLDGPIKKSEIEKIVTLATNIVPDDIPEENVWDVTADSKGNVNEDIKGKVMAWYKDEDNDDLYEVYIGQEGGVKANEYSNRLFAYLPNLTEIDLSKMDTSNVETMVRMFGGSSSLTNLDLSNFDTSKVTDMSYMFMGCSKLQTIDVSNFNTENVTEMNYMFYGCSKLTELNLSNFRTSNVKRMDWMFMNCGDLTSLDLSNFDTSNVTAMTAMFRNCSSLTSLDLSSFNTSNVTDMSYMFNHSSSLTEIIVSNKWKTADVKDGMFSNCGVKEVTYK